MREVSVNTIRDAVASLCIQANKQLPEDLTACLLRAQEQETQPLPAGVMTDLVNNLAAAKELDCPICQDCGMAVVFLEIGQDVHLVDGLLTDAVNEGVRRGYREGYLRCSVVEDPLLRKNTGDNTPAVMAGREDIIQFVLDSVKTAGGNPCPPIVLGIGIGGDFEQCAYLAKKALCRPVSVRHEKEYYKQLELELLERINQLGVGPQGFGGRTTALAVNVETAPTHIAGLPVAVNFGCHVTRHMSRTV